MNEDELSKVQSTLQELLSKQDMYARESKNSAYDFVTKCCKIIGTEISQPHDDVKLQVVDIGVIDITLPYMILKFDLNKSYSDIKCILNDGNIIPAIDFVDLKFTDSKAIEDNLNRTLASTLRNLKEYYKVHREVKHWQFLTNICNFEN